MSTTFNFFDEGGKLNTVSFEVTCSQAERPYGIHARLVREDGAEDTADAAERFFTVQEAEQTIQMLAQYQVTPCTLCDLL